MLNPILFVYRMIRLTFYEFLSNFFGFRRIAKSKRQLPGKVVVITGANTGIGKETAFQMTLRKAKVYIGCRDVKKAETAVAQIKALNPGADIHVLRLDLSSLKSVRMFAKELSSLESTIDILINNAGVMACPEWQTEDGFEMQFGTNHLGHFLLTMHLLPLIKRSSNARIVNVSSCGHQLGDINLNNIMLRNGAYSPMIAYGQSKLANVLFTRELARRLTSTNVNNVNVYSLNPGAIQTDLARHSDMSKGSVGKFIQRYFFMKPCMGSQTTLYCSLDEQLDNESGFYYNNCRRVTSMVSTATDDHTARKLWDLSVDLVGLEKHLEI
ncbi:retinol dehydrogenase 11-like [Oppia nitens]|uniref:retinol dehydrogenase 11-like n=1 Tax=Oppia nitens TaxID=1686743 RepID=UPI0023D9A99A|nr:retinol dehydrogenase 11-like [Oppia nitens]